MRRNNERGEGRAKLVIWLAIIASVLYVSFKIVPAFVNNYQLQDTLDGESRLYAARQKTDEQVRETVWREIVSLQVPARREDIQVFTAGRTAHVAVTYTVTVDLPGYQWTHQFSPSGESPII